MSCVVFLLEEPSAREMLKGLLPRVFPSSIEVVYLVFEGKADLMRNIVPKIRGWRRPDSSFVIVRDKDSLDCKIVKEQIVGLCHQALRNDVLVRIACPELETFFLGDLPAVEQGLGVSGLAQMQLKRKYREPDKLSNPVKELERLIGEPYSKIRSAREIGPHLDLDGNFSQSFGVLVAGLRKIAQHHQAT